MIVEMCPWEGRIVRGAGTWEYVITNASISSMPLCHTDHMFRHECDYQAWTGEEGIIAWGYEGNGPRQLAFTILVYGSFYYNKSAAWSPMAKRYSEAFMKDFVSQWGDQWKITLEEVIEWIKKQEQKNKKDQDDKDSNTNASPCGREVAEGLEGK